MKIYLQALHVAGKPAPGATAPRSSSSRVLCSGSVKLVTERGNSLVSYPRRFGTIAGDRKLKQVYKFVPENPACVEFSYLCCGSTRVQNRGRCRRNNTLPPVSTRGLACHQAANTPRELQLFTMSMNAPILRALGSFRIPCCHHGAAHGLAEQTASYLSASASSSSEGTLGIQPCIDPTHACCRHRFHFSFRPSFRRLVRLLLPPFSYSVPMFLLFLCRTTKAPQMSQLDQKLT